MAFASTRIGMVQLGRRRWMSFGRFTNAKTDTGGDIDTGLKLVDDMWLTPRSTGASNTSYCINEAIQSGAIAGNAVTVVTSAHLDGTWTAIGIR